MKKLPVEYINRMKLLLGNEYEQYEKSVNDSPIRAFRVNTDKISIDEFELICDINREKIPYVENGFYLDLANSQYLDINIKKEVLNEVSEGLVEDVRFNKPAKDGEQFAVFKQFVCWS